MKIADLRMLAIEKRELKSDSSAWAVLAGIDTAHVEHLVDLREWSPLDAETRFLHRYEELRPR